MVASVQKRRIIGRKVNPLSLNYRSKQNLLGNIYEAVCFVKVWVWRTSVGSSWCLCVVFWWPSSWRCWSLCGCCVIRQQQRWERAILLASAFCRSPRPRASLPEPPSRTSPPALQRIYLKLIYTGHHMLKVPDAFRFYTLKILLSSFFFCILFSSLNQINGCVTALFQMKHCVFLTE